MTDHTAAWSVVWPDDGERVKQRAPSELSAEMTLVEFFWQYAWPDCLQPKGDSPATRKDYAKSLDYWAEFTGNPPIEKIDKRTCSKFLRLLRGVRGQRGEVLSQNTVFKHWTNIQRLLDWTGPQGRGNRNGTDLVQNPPWIEAPRKEFAAPKRAFTLEELWTWLTALPKVARPMPKVPAFEPAAWWRAVILLGYNTGMRPGTLFRIRWEMFEENALRIPTSIIKGKHGRLLCVNDAAREAIEPLRRATGLVFGWENWPEADTTLKKHRERQQREAGLSPLSLYGLRRTFATECGKINPLAAQIMMGHQGLGMQMMVNHYIDAEQLLSEALSRLPQPGLPRQKLLF